MSSATVCGAITDLLGTLRITSALPNSLWEIGDGCGRADDRGGSRWADHVSSQYRALVYANAGLQTSQPADVAEFRRGDYTSAILFGIGIGRQSHGPDFSKPELQAIADVLGVDGSTNAELREQIVAGAGCIRQTRGSFTREELPCVAAAVIYAVGDIDE